MEPTMQMQQELDVFPAVLLAQLPLACELRASHPAFEAEVRLQLGQPQPTEPDAPRSDMPQASAALAEAARLHPSATGSTTVHEPTNRESMSCESASHSPGDHSHIIFDRDEVRWLIVGAQMERFAAEDFVSCCRRKVEQPGHRLEGSEALAGLPATAQRLAELESELLLSDPRSVLEVIAELELQLAGLTELTGSTTEALATAA